MGNVSCERNQEQFVLYNFFFENRVVRNIKWTGQATDDNMAHAHRILDT
jgi:hypothetical protein